MIGRGRVDTCPLLYFQGVLKMADELIDVPEEEIPQGEVPQVDPQLEAVKVRLSISGEYHDNLIMSLIEDVKGYMVSAGVKEEIVNGSKSIGCIARGVADMWNMGAGDGSFSEMFRQRVIQLTAEDVPEPETESEVQEDELQA